MKTLIRETLTSIVAMIVLTLILCGVYPAVVWGISQAAFSNKANGTLVVRNGNVIGSDLLAQNFADAKYFHPRPSAAGTGYDAANSSGTNLGPTSQKLMDSVKQRVEDYRKENNLPADVKIPCDAVTSSASGLDPHITPENAKLQIARVAKARGMNEEKVRALIDQNTEGPDFGIFGEARVNVLRVNLALDAANPQPAVSVAADKGATAAETPAVIPATEKK